jgi:hypothetical protein
MQIIPEDACHAHARIGVNIGELHSAARAVRIYSCTLNTVPYPYGPAEEAVP